uniref:Putative secreted protein n=1 Tax=Ixodes ricinus TaxID=34613 RepID=A0A6B0U316_IXORI
MICILVALLEWGVYGVVVGSLRHFLDRLWSNCGGRWQCFIRFPYRFRGFLGTLGRSRGLVAWTGGGRLPRFISGLPLWQVARSCVFSLRLIHY